MNWITGMPPALAPPTGKKVTDIRLLQRCILTGIDRLTHQPLSFSVSETTKGVHIHIVDAELMGKGEKEKKDLYIEGIQNNGIISHYEYISEW